MPKEKPRTLLQQMFLPAPRTQEQVKPKVNTEAPWAPLTKPLEGRAGRAVGMAEEALKAGPLGAIKAPLPTSESTVADIVSEVFLPKTPLDVGLAAVPPAKIKAAGMLFRKLPVGKFSDVTRGYATAASKAIKAAEKGTKGAERAILDKAKDTMGSRRISSDIAAETQQYTPAMRNSRTGEVYVPPDLKTFRNWDLEPESELYLIRKSGAQTKEELEALEESGQLEAMIKELDKVFERTGNPPADWNQFVGDFDIYGAIGRDYDGNLVFAADRGSEDFTSINKKLQGAFDDLEKRMSKPKVVDLSKGEGTIRRLDLPSGPQSSVTDDELDRLDDLFMPKSKPKKTVH